MLSEFPTSNRVLVPQAEHGCATRHSVQPQRFVTHRVCCGGGLALLLAVDVSRSRAAPLGLAVSPPDGRLRHRTGPRNRMDR